MKSCCEGIGAIARKARGADCCEDAENSWMAHCTINGFGIVQRVTESKKKQHLLATKGAGYRLKRNRGRGIGKYI